MNYSRRFSKIGRYTIIAIGAIIMLYPVLWMISSSFKPATTIFTQPGIIPQKITTSNYSNGWVGTSGYSFTTFYINSLIMVLLAIIGNVFSCSLTAYAFARLQFRGKNILFAFMMLTLMIPLHLLVIPQYIIFSKLNWLNTILPIVVPKFFAVDAFFIFLSVQFIRGIPKDLDEAAKLDGCSLFSTYFKVILPLTVPSIITTIIFTFVWTWNDFFSQMLYLSSIDQYTVTLALRMFLDAEEATLGPFFAMSTLSIVPIFLSFLFTQKYLVEGVATTGFK